MPKLKLLVKLAVLTFLLFCLWVFSGNAMSPQEQRSAVPMKIRGLADAQGKIVVGLQCQNAYLTTLDTIGKLSCELKNGSSKNITAANIKYSFIVEKDGQRSKEVRSETIDTSLTLSGDNKAIRSGSTQTAGLPGVTGLGGMILRMYVEVDYVQFDDGTTLGEDAEAVEKIQQWRKGADSYRQWLAKKYEVSGNSTVVISSLLNDADPIPESLKKEVNQRMGAQVVQKRLLKILNSEGADAVAKQLGKPVQ